MLYSLYGVYEAAVEAAQLAGVADRRIHAVADVAESALALGNAQRRANRDFRRWTKDAVRNGDIPSRTWQAPASQGDFALLSLGRQDRLATMLEAIAADVASVRWYPVCVPYLS